MRRILALAATVFLLSGLVLAQGVQTGELKGTVKLQDGSAAPGASVTIESTALQGKRTQVTGPKGDYVFKLLPPGPYTVTVELSGMGTAVQKVSVPVGNTVWADATLQVATTAAVTVTATAVEAEKVAVHGTARDIEEVQQLPVGRTIDQIASIAPA